MQNNHGKIMGQPGNQQMHRRKETRHQPFITPPTLIMTDKYGNNKRADIQNHIQNPKGIAAEIAVKATAQPKSDNRHRPDN